LIKFLLLFKEIGDELLELGNTGGTPNKHDFLNFIFS
jgi:hypothetical protein